ncbi:BZ3500_MvSof-1268-A1-R1_Chr2-3g05288 [Microbotryum saponariae]|uniref:BZ3500_MvSof-1268-A1-R1_Chr2-3g05288 protein n=1 Tax=Microbotryum saponariae TaxID=289078 RepID=A0A2X0N277_9BASI|nr:BZ3500_MvSof-1268-A1-R1_Chr2-3g05288 [Microbotryum saponariae]SDA01122.1 BZ3501_MvSof-1269-A2-R1_Chr2-2g04961 [Microbotryum saponariae]
MFNSPPTCTSELQRSSRSTLGRDVNAHATASTAHAPCFHRGFTLTIPPVYIPSRLYPTAYRSIVSSARGSSSATTFLLVSPDVDALCAARLLSDLLKTDDVVNTIIPVGSWSDLEDVRERLQGETVRSLVLLNLGALVDLYDYFEEFLPDTCLVHVIDSHRPINLANLFRTTTYANALFDLRRSRGKARSDGNLPPPEFNIVVWSDAENDDSREGEKEAWEALLYEPESDSDSDDDDDSDDEYARNRRRNRSGTDSDEDQEEDEDGNRIGKRRRTSQEPQALSKNQRRRFRARIDKYYTAGTFFGQSVAGQVFVLAVLLERADTDAVWLAILGLAHQFSINAIDRERYEGYVSLLADEVARLSTNAASLATHSGDALASTGPNDRSIRPSEEIRFCLFRHWNLYDSMYHSGYLGSRMKLWTEKGRKNLSGMLAKMGCPLSESSETYQHMATDLKASLFGKIENLAPEYGLHDLIVPSFVRKSGYRTDISAADAVEALGALLEVATGVRLNFGNAVGGRRGIVLGGHEAARENGGREEWSEGLKSWVGKGEAHGQVVRRMGAGDKENRRPDGAATEEEEEESEMDKKARMEKDWALRNFWLAWDALAVDTTLLRSALPLSMALHRAVMDQGGYILEKQSIQSLRAFRFAVIKEGPDLAVFRHPSTLLRLAVWLVDAVRDLVASKTATGKRPKPLPFVLASLNEASDAFLVVGIVGAPEYGDVKKNAFGMAFERAAHASGASTRHNAFEASVIEVRKDDLDKFFKDLAMAMA